MEFKKMILKVLPITALSVGLISSLVLFLTTYTEKMNLSLKVLGFTLSYGIFNITWRVYNDLNDN